MDSFISDPLKQNKPSYTIGRSLYWWAESLRMLKKYPIHWYLMGVACSFTFYVVSNFLERIPWLPVIVVPLLMSGIATVGKAQAQGEQPQLQHLRNGFKNNKTTLLGIGMMMSLLMIVIRSFIKVMMYGYIRSHEGIVVAVFIVLTLLLVWTALWSPMIAVFQRVSAAEAIKRSLKILWGRATIAYLLTLIAGGTAFVLALAAPEFFYLNGKILIIPYALILLLLPVLISWVALSAFVAYGDIFPVEDEDATPLQQELQQRLEQIRSMKY